MPEQLLYSPVDPLERVLMAQAMRQANVPVGPWRPSESIWESLAVLGSALGNILPGTLTGIEAPTLMKAAPRLAQFLERSPRVVDVSLGSRRGLAGFTRPDPRGGGGIVIRLMPGATPATPIHEGLHAAYYLKGTGGFPPREHLSTLAKWAMEKVKSPEAIRRWNQIARKRSLTQEERMGELVIEAMTRNVLEKSRLAP